MPTINFDIQLYDNGYGEHMGKGQVEAVMVFPADKAMRNRYWKAVSRDYLRAKISALDTWPVTLGKWEFDALANGENLSGHFVKAKEEARQAGWLAAQALRFVLRAHMSGHPQHGSINRWIYHAEMTKGITIPWNGKAYVCKPTLLDPLKQFAIVSHLWAALFNDDGTEKNISTDWDAFIAEARWFQRVSENGNLLIKNKASAKAKGFWLVPDGPEETVAERRMEPFTRAEIDYLNGYRAH